jgi:hypothetical protein
MVCAKSSRKVGDGKMLVRLLILYLILPIISFCGIAGLIHICSKNKYSIDFQSGKRKLKIYPNDNEDKSRVPIQNTTVE